MCIRDRLKEDLDLSFWNKGQRMRAKGAAKQREPVRVLRSEKGVLLQDDEERREETQNFFGNLYKANGPCPDIDLTKPTTQEDMDKLRRRITASRVKKCVRKMKKHKTCDEDDGLVAEMLQETPEEMFEALADTFEKRARIGPREGDDSWEEYEVILLRKIPEADRPSKFRGISIIHTMRKLYFMVLADAMGYDSMAFGETQFAFRKYYRATEVIFILRQLGEKGKEFKKDYHILDGDIYKAYDSVEHCIWVEAMRSQGNAEAGIRAKLKEWDRCKPSFLLPGHEKTAPVHRTRSLEQGDPAAPADFNAVMDLPTQSFCLLYTSPSPRDGLLSRMPSSA